MRKAAKLPLDFTHRIRYNKSRSKTMRRCVGMADEGDSKSLVLITRVGSTPTTGIKKKLPSSSGEFLFCLRRVSGSNSTALLCRASDQPCGLSLSARETPTTGIKRELLQLVWGSFLFICLRRVSGSNSTALTKNVPETRTAPICQTVWYTAQEMGRFIFCAAASAFYPLRPLRVPTVPFRLILPPQKAVFACRICGRSASRLSREWPPVLPKGRTIPEKKTSKYCSGHLFYYFLPFLQCFLQKRLYK